MHRYLLPALAVVAAPVFAQNSTFVAQRVQTLESLNLTSLANASAVVANTSTGATLLSALSNGPATVFAHNNDACEPSLRLLTATKLSCAPG